MRQNLFKIAKVILAIIASIIGILIFIAILFINLSSEFGSKSKGKFKERLVKSAHFVEENFKNIEETVVMKTRNGDKVPDFSLPVVKIPKNYFSATSDSMTRLTWFGHSAVLLEIDGKKIFLDPMLGDVQHHIRGWAQSDLMIHFRLQ